MKKSILTLLLITLVFDVYSQLEKNNTIKYGNHELIVIDKATGQKSTGGELIINYQKSIKLKSAPQANLLLDSVVSVANNYSLKDIYSYDSNNNVIQILSSSKSSDSLVWENSFKHEYAYKNGFKTYESSYTWNNYSSKWKGSQQFAYDFDNVGNQTLFINFNWDDYSFDWIPTTKDESIFNENGNVTNTLGYVWDATLMDWTKNHNRAVTYDINGLFLTETRSRWDSVTLSWIGYFKSDLSNRSEYTYYSWDSNTSTWFPNAKYEIKLDENNNILSSIYNYWNVNTLKWITASKMESSYDNHNHQISEINYLCDSLTLSWIPRNKTENAYDNGGNLISALSYTWDTNTSSWAPDGKYESSYTDKGLQLFFCGYYWNTSSSSWVGAYQKSEFVYDELGRLTSSLVSYWNDTKNNWEYFSKSDNIYNSFGNISQRIYSTWNINLNTWVLESLSTYYYKTISGINNIVQDKICIYPNPATEILHINGLDGITSFSIFDLKGNILYKNSTNGNINVCGLNDGVYLLRINTGKEEIIRKFEKRK